MHCFAEEYKFTFRMGTIKWSHERSNKLSPPLHQKSALQSESTERRRRVDVLMMILDVSFNSRREWNVWGKLDCGYSPKDPHCEGVFIPQHREPPACDTILNQNNFLFVIRALIPACFYSYLHLTTNMSLFFKKKSLNSIIIILRQEVHWATLNQNVSNES